MITQKPQLVQRTYERDGAWYTLAVIDRTNQIERLATDEEIAAATTPGAPDSPPAEVPAGGETSAALRESTADEQTKPPRKKPGRKPKA